MKYIASFLILCFGLVRIANAQWLETTICISDSVGYPKCLAYNSTNNTVYAGGDGECVIAIDGETNQRIAWIPAGEAIHDLVWNSTNNKVYSANYYSNSVTIIDGATNSVIAAIPVGNYPRALVWNSINNRTYVANEVRNLILIK